MPRGTAEGNFEVEIDGIPTFRATKVTGGGEKHEPVQIAVGNDPYPHNVRGNINPDDVSITIPTGMYEEAIFALEVWYENYADGFDVQPRSGRYIVYDEAGFTPLETRDLREMIPLGKSPDDRSARGNGGAAVTFMFKPNRSRRL